MSFDVSQESAFAPEQAVAPLWTPLALFAPLHARLSGTMPQPVFGVSIDTRTLMPRRSLLRDQGRAQRRTRSCA